jgi:hypothetical protein
MLKKIYLLLFLINIMLPAAAQNRNVSGFIEDAETGERLPGAYVRTTSSMNGAVSNSYGFFSLSITPTDSSYIVISYIGYAPAILQLPDTSTTLRVRLKKSAQIQEIHIIGNKNRIEQRNEVSVIDLAPAQLKNLPALGGESDLMKILQLTPSVQGGSEGSSEIYVRGGSPDQNLILLDDIPLYYVNHLGGFVSIFNSDAIKKTRLIKGGFPAKYGNRLSSVLDVGMKEGNLQNISGNISLGMVSSKLLIEGPIKKDTTSFLLSGRRLMYDVITKPLSGKLFDGLSVGYTFYDVNIKLNHKFSAKDRLFLSFYKGDDKIAYKYKDKKNTTDKAESLSVWGNTLWGLRWNHIFGKKLFKNTVLYSSIYNNETEQSFKTEDSDYYIQFFSGIKDLGLKNDFEYACSNKLKINWGTNFVYHRFSPSIITYESVHRKSEYTAYELALYAEAELNIFKHLSSIAGMRFSDYIAENKTFFSYEPRIILNIKLADYLSLKPAWSVTRQNIHLLSNSAPGITKAIWVPATIFAPPEYAEQFSVSAVSSLNSEQYELSIEYYKKNMQNLIAFKEGMSYFSGAGAWEEKIETDGTGSSLGYEVLFRKKHGSYTGWLAYTWSKTMRRFDNINEGIAYRYEYDRRHDISIALTFRVDERQTVSAAWVFSSGTPITLPIAKYNALHSDRGTPFEYTPDYIYKQEAYIYSERNALQMKNYHRLDINMNFYKKKKRSTRTLSFGIYNVYARQNPYFYYIDKKYIYDENGNITGYSTPVVKQVSFFPFVPSVSYNLEF